MLQPKVNGMIFEVESGMKSIVKGAWVILLLCLALGLSHQVAAQELLEWTNPEGKSVTGEFIQMDKNSVKIRNDSGREIEIPLSSLSFESHLQALKLAKPEEFSKELVKAPEAIEPVALSTSAPLGSITESPFGEDTTIDEFIRIAVGEWKRGNNFVVWHMLPPRMQQDLQQLVFKNLQAFGPEGLNQMRSAVSLMASLASKKRDWIIESDLAALFPVQGDSPEAKEQWPVMVGMLEKASDRSLWQPENFQGQSLTPWFASVSELLAYVKELNGDLNEVSANVVSQSAERAEVEVTFGSMEPVTYQFQKVGNIWVVPEIMNELRANLDQQLSDQGGSQMTSLIGTILPVAIATLTKLDQSKTRNDFDKLLQEPLMKQILANVPKWETDRGPLEGLPPMPGIPSFLFGFPGGGL